MPFNGLIQFDNNGRLYINHACSSCQRFPLEDLNMPCFECGYSRLFLITLEGKVNRANKAIDLMAQAITDNDDEEIDVREAFLQIKEIKLGGSELDTLVLQDLDMTDEIRGLADLAEHMVRVIIYPTNMRMIESDMLVDLEFDED